MAQNYNPSGERARQVMEEQARLNPFNANGVGLQGPSEEESFETGEMDLPGAVGLGLVDSPVLDNPYADRTFDNPDAFDSMAGINVETVASGLWNEQARANTGELGIESLFPIAETD